MARQQSDRGMTWQEWHSKWQKLADRGYGEGCLTPDQMERTDGRIRKAKLMYERLLREEKSRNGLDIDRKGE